MGSLAPKGERAGVRGISIGKSYFHNYGFEQAPGVLDYD
jgi:hypothetical protein